MLHSLREEMSRSVGQAQKSQWSRDAGRLRVWETHGTAGSHTNPCRPQAPELCEPGTVCSLQNSLGMMHYPFSTLLGF